MEKGKQYIQMPEEKRLEMLIDLHKETEKNLLRIKEYKDNSDRIISQILSSIENMKELYPKLQSIKEHTLKSIKDVYKISLIIKEKKSVVNLVENYIDQGDRIILKYIESLNKLKNKKIDKKLIEHLYDDVNDPKHTFTLFDWANVHELNIIEAALNSELDQLGTIPGWADEQLKLVNTQYKTIKERYKRLEKDFNLDVDFSPNFKSVISDHKEVIDSQHHDLDEYYSHISNTLKHAKEDEHPVLNLPSFLNWGQLIESKYERTNKSFEFLKRTEEDLVEKSEKLSRLYSEIKAIRAMTTKLAGECKSIITELEYLETEFTKKDITSNTSHYVQLKNSALAWERFSYEYDNMIDEVRRRSAIQKRNEQIMKAYQKELDFLAEREESERNAFAKRYLDSKESYLPDTWKSIPFFSEPVRRYEIQGLNPLNNLPSLLQDSLNLTENDKDI